MAVPRGVRVNSCRSDWRPAPAGSRAEADAAGQGESESTAGGAADEAGARRVLVVRTLRPSGGDRPIVQTGKADARTRTADPFITSEVLYQLSYVGGASEV